MITHLCKLVWNRKRTNILIVVEILVSFLVLVTVIVPGVYYADNYRCPLGFSYENVWYISMNPYRPPVPGAGGAGTEEDSTL